jgi:ubiquinone/menaquinone biosynthesis C-methylase UbiE
MSGIASATGRIKVLDNGSGDGIVAQQVWDNIPPESREGLEIVCGDLSPVMVQLAQRRIEMGGWRAAKTTVMDMQVSAADCGEMYLRLGV